MPQANAADIKGVLARSRGIVRVVPAISTATILASDVRLVGEDVFKPEISTKAEILMQNQNLLGRL